MKKPGWVRLNFSYLMSEETVQFIIDSVNDLSRRTEEFAPFTTPTRQPRASRPHEGIAAFLNPLRQV